MTGSGAAQTGARRLVRTGLAAVLAAALLAQPVIAASGTDMAMYGLIGEIAAVPGRRDALIAILIEGTKVMPGCLSYVIAKDAADPDRVLITEVWDSKASHDASMALPAVRHAIAAGRPLIASMNNSRETVPVGGTGLYAPKVR